MFILISPKGQYISQTTRLANWTNTPKVHLEYTYDINEAIVFNQPVARYTDWYELAINQGCVELPAFEVRRVIIGVKPNQDAKTS